MKVIPSKPENHSPSLANADNSQAAAPSSPLSFIYSMMQASSEMEPAPIQTKPSDMGEKSDQASASADEALLEQVNIANLNIPTLPDQKNSDPGNTFILDMTKPNQTISDPAINSVSEMKKPNPIDANQLKTNQFKPSIPAKMTLPQGKMTQNVVDNYIDTKKNIEDSTAQLTEVSTDVNTNASIAESVSSDLLNQINKIIPDEKPNIKLPTMSSNLKTSADQTIVDQAFVDQAIVDQAMNANSKLEPKPIDQMSTPILNSLHEPINHQQNKYVDAFVQLGNLINSHTLQMTHEQTNISTQLPKATHTDEILKNSLPPEYELNIELSQPSVSAHMKESYEAKIKIYPPELGHVTAKLKVDKNHTELVIMAENNRVKEIVESNLSQLREKFQQADINITTIQVFAAQADANTKGQNNSNQRHYSEPYLSKDSANELETKNLSPKESARTINTIVDTYA